jgi:uncharacterized phage-like protein YoqJ
MIIKKCAFSGHRPKSFPWGYVENNKHCIWLKQQIDNKIEQAISDGFNYFIAGGAMGVDMWCAECVISKKEKYGQSNIMLEVAIPFIGYDKWFSGQIKQRLENIINLSDKRVVITNKVTTSHLNMLYHARNKYLVNSSHRLIAVYDENTNITGGTFQTYQYAKKKNKEIVTINWLSEYNSV